MKYLYLLLSSLLAVPVFAATTTAPCQLAAPGSVTATLSTPGVTSLNCGQFDPALGQLTSAALVLDFQKATGSATVENPSASSISSFYLPLNYVVPFGSRAGVVSVPASIGAGQTQTVNFTSTILTGPIWAVDLAPFQGNGTINVPLTISFLANPAVTFHDMNVTVSAVNASSYFMGYIYTPVPEPGTFALLGGALVLAAAVGRRR